MLTAVFAFLAVDLLVWIIAEKIAKKPARAEYPDPQNPYRKGPQ